MSNIKLNNFPKGLDDNIDQAKIIYDELEKLAKAEKTPFDDDDVKKTARTHAKTPPVGSDLPLNTFSGYRIYKDRYGNVRFVKDEPAESKKILDDRHKAGAMLKTAALKKGKR